MIQILTHARIDRQHIHTSPGFAHYHVALQYLVLAYSAIDTQELVLGGVLEPRNHLHSELVQRRRQGREAARAAQQHI